MSYRTIENDRRGFALPAVIGALVIIGVLITSGFFVAQQELRVGVASNYSNMAVNIAQAGANEVMGNWNGYQLGNIAVWGDTTVTGTTDGGDWEVTIANRNNFIYFLTATGEVTEGGQRWAGASRTIGIVTKMLFIDIDPPAALTTQGKTMVKGGAVISGINTEPPGWSSYCTGFPTNDTTGVMADDTSQVSAVGTSQMIGNPAEDQDSLIAWETFNEFGDMAWDDLRALAAAEGKDISSLGFSVTQVLPDTTATGRCNEATLTNWGDTLPTAPCGSYFPLIYTSGSLSLQSGAGFGQGILLVEGDLQMQGDFLFYGIIIVQGWFRTSGSGNRVLGAVLAGNSEQDQNGGALGSSFVGYSRCAVMRAILNNASLSRSRPLHERSWVDLTAVSN